MAATITDGLKDISQADLSSLKESMAAVEAGARALADEIEKVGKAVTNASRITAPGSMGFQGGSGSSTATSAQVGVQVVSKDDLIEALNRTENPYQMELLKRQAEVADRIGRFGDKMTDTARAAEGAWLAAEYELGIKALEYDRLGENAENVARLQESAAKTQAQLAAITLKLANATDSIQINAFKDQENRLKQQYADIISGIDYNQGQLKKYGRTDLLSDAPETYTVNDIVNLLRDASLSTSGDLKNLIDTLQTSFIKDKEVSPTKTYQIDLAIGDEKLRAYSESSPEKFIAALLNAKRTVL